jgi:hypothetical protein
VAKSIYCIIPHKIPSDDPLPFARGYTIGFMDKECEKDVSIEYIRGYELGVEVRLGTKPRPDFHEEEQ